MLTKYSVKRPFTIIVAVIIVIVFGCVALYKMTPDLFPSISAPYSIVMTTYPGASGEEVEREITDPMEQQLATLSKLDNITSVSSDNYSVVTLQFTDDVNMDSMTVDIRDKIDQIEGSLPENAATPVVMKINMDMMPVTIAAVGMKNKTPVEVSKYVKENLETKLEGIEGVASVNKVGMIDEGIQVVLSQEDIDAVNKKVSAAINSQFSKGEKQLKSGIKQAEKGSEQLDDAKAAIKSGNSEAASQFDSIIKMTKSNKTEKEKALRNEEGKLRIAENNLKIEKDKLAEEESKSSPDPEKIEKYKTNIKKYESEIETAEENINIDETYISAFEKAIAEAEKQKEGLSFELGTKYSDSAAAQVSVNSIVSDLQKTLADVESQKDAAIDSADMTGVITMENVSAILSAQNFSMPAGYVSDGDAQILVSVGDKIKDTDELQNLILFDMGIDGLDPIRVNDVATVSYLADDSDSYARINGENGVLLLFTKQSNYATATVADNVNAKFKELEKEFDGLKFTTLMDQGEYIHVVINSVFKDLILGAIFAILILLFFLRDIRPTVITAVSIPVSVIFAIALMYFTGVTLNLISMSGLAIGVGMLVDNSIVVIENTYRLRSLGYSPVQAAVSGAGQVAGAITSSTLTTICVFVPIVFVTGMTKDLFIDLALTVTYSLVASLLIALTFVPAVSKGLLVKKTRKTVLGQKGRVVTKYKLAAAWCLTHRKRVILAALVLLVASTSLLLTKGFEFMPSMSSSQISAETTMPEGSDFEDTKRVNDELSKELQKIDGVESVGVMLSSEMDSMFGMDVGSDADYTKTNLYIVMDDKKLKQGKVVQKTLEEFGKKHNMEIVSSADVDMSEYTGGSGVSLTLYGEDLDDLRTSASDIEDRLNDMDSLEKVSDIGDTSTDELKITVNKNAAMKKGLTVAQVYQQVSEKLAQEKTATKLSTDDSSIDVSVENTTKDNFTKANLMDMELTLENKSSGSSDSGSDGSGDKEKKVKLTSIATISNDASLSTINHNDQKRSQDVTADLKDGYNITKVNKEIQNMVEDEQLLRGNVTVDYGGENEQIMDSMKQLVLMMLVGMLLVYLIMVAQFQSLRSPFIIIFTLPLAFTGGALGLLVSNQILSVVSMMGFVMLVGIVVNNGIVLVDCINRFRLEGMDIDQAIIEAGAVRMRPVLMTAATTVLGLIPLALGFGEGAEMVQPVAIVCIGGLIYATITTLFVIPIMYRWLSKKKMVKIEEEELEIVSA